jgi:hypothetical protein
MGSEPGFEPEMASEQVLGRNRTDRAGLAGLGAIWLGSGWGQAGWQLDSVKSSLFHEISGNQAVRVSSIDHFIVKSTFQMTGHGWHLNQVFFKNVPRRLSFSDPKLDPGSIF